MDRSNSVTVRAMYQKIMITLFHNIMHLKVKMYVDGILAKLNEDHVKVLRRLFKRLKISIKIEPC